MIPIHKEEVKKYLEKRSGPHSGGATNDGRRTGLAIQQRCK